MAERELILAIETSCDDTCAAVLDGPRMLSNVISSQAAAHARFGGVVPEVASRHHLELTVPVVEAALDEAGATLDEIDAVAVTAGPGPDRRAAGRRQHGQGDRRAAPAAADPGRPPAGPRRRQLPRARAARAALPLPGRQRRPHAAGRGPRPRRPRGARPDPRRRRRRGLRQGRPPARPRLSRAARRCSGWPRTGDPEAFELPVAMSRDPGLDFSFSGLKTALVYLCRDLGPEGVGERRADLAASFQAAAVGQLVAEAGAGAEAGRVGGGRARRRRRRQRAAARGGARRSASERGVRLKLVAARALHRQRRDDRLRRPLRRRRSPIPTTSPTTPSPAAGTPVAAA